MQLDWSASSKAFSMLIRYTGINTDKGAYNVSILKNTNI